MAKKFDRQPLPEEIKKKIPKKVSDIFAAFAKEDFDLWLVGGGVRNLLSGKVVRDPDFTTNATPEQIQKIFPDSFYDNNFGTVGVPRRKLKHAGGQATPKIQRAGGQANKNEKEEIFEITTFRTEQGYSDRRRPDKVEWGKTLEEDLARRDFTINAIVIGFDQKKKNDSGFKIHDLRFIDPFNGEADLKNKKIKAVGDADDRFSEDALRMMRAIRIGTQLGFTVERKTLEAIRKHGKHLEHVSKERIREELMKIIASDYPADGILLLHSAKILEYVIPEMLQMRGVKQIGHHIYDVWTHSIESLRECPSSDSIIRLATLLHDIGKPKTAKPRDGKEITFYGHEVVGARIVSQIARRLRFSKKDSELMVMLVRRHMFAYEPKMTDAAIRRFIRRVGKDHINQMMMLRVGDRKGGGSKTTSWRLQELQQRVGEQLYEPITVKDLKINGHDLMKELKIKPGPKIGKLLSKLFEEVIEDSRKNTKEKLLARAKEIN